MADLNKLGGLVAVIGELDREEAELRTAAASVLGKASQNNPIVQAQVRAIYQSTYDLSGVLLFTMLKDLKHLLGLW